MSKQVIEIVNEKILEKMEKGVNPWKKGWVSSGGYMVNRPYNYVTNKPYRGLNLALLESGYYVSYKQLQELGGKLKKGATPYFVTYSQPKTYTAEVVNPDTEELEEIEKQGWIMKYYWVYNLNDCEGYRQIKNRELPQPKEYNEVEAIEEAEKIIADYVKRDGLDLYNLEQNQAYYMPSSHKVVLPLRNQFNGSAEYYATAFHELGHSTSKQLKRELGSKFGTEKYAKEELVAEICAIYCTSQLEIEGCFDNNIAYLQSWASHIRNKENKYFLSSAMSKAQKAFEYIFNVGA